MVRYWIGVVPKDYVEIAKEGKFCQVCNGKKYFIEKMKANDKLIYYSPKENSTSTTKYQKFVATGTINSLHSYQVEMLEGFFPFRKNMTFEVIEREVSLAEIRDNPEWKQVRANLRFGQLEISESLFYTIYNKLMLID